MSTHPYTRLFTGKTSAPTVNDDVSLGYEVGDQWVDETNNNIYEAVDVTDTAAVWKLVNLGSYGSMYADDITQAVTVGAANTYYHVPGSLTGGLCSADFTFQNSKELLCNTAGTYLVFFGMSIGSSNNNENISGAAMINTTEIHQSEGSAQVINGLKPIHVGGSAIVTLAVNDLVRLCVQNEDAAHDITVYHANLTVLRVG